MGFAEARSAPVTRTLGRYLARSRWDDLAPFVVHEGKRSFINWIGCAIGGSRDESVATALRALLRLAPQPQAALVGRRERLDVLNAALLNAMSAMVLDFDDAHAGSRIVLHPAGAVGAAALAVAERQRADGRALLHAFIQGIEIECRIGNALYASDETGWYTTSTMGVLGAAAAAGCVLQLDEERMTWALGIAAAQSAGLRATHGSMTKSFSVGSAASRGCLAALLASEGLTCAEDAIEARNTGLADLAGTSEHLASVLEGLGEKFEIARNTYKPFPCAAGLHAAVDGCLRLCGDRAIAADDIAGVAIRVHPRVATVNGNKHPATGLAAKLSIYHAVAAALTGGAAGEAQFSDEKARADDIIALRGRITVLPDATCRKDEADVTVLLRDTRELAVHVDHAVGGIANPLDDAALARKAMKLAEVALPPERAAKLVDLCWDLPALKDLGVVMHAAVP